MRTDCDVAVLGAGPAGAAAARRLAQSGCRVVLLERSRFETLRVGESLAPAIQPLLVELGVWSQFMALSPLPSHGTRSVWGDSEAQDHSHMISAYGCGWHIDRLAFDRMLAQAAVEAGAELRCGAALVHCESTNDGGWLLRLNENGTGDPILRGARVLIDATGRAAHLARWVGAQRAVLDRLVGLATLFADVDTSREGFVLVETSHEGWWYSAPIPPERMMVMLMTDSDVCGRAKLATRPRWHQLLANAQQTVGRVGGVALWGPRVFSAVSQRLRRSELRAPWLAAGDAALAVDPVSGSGVIRALRSARASARTALAVLEGHADGAIKAYEDDVDLDCTKYLRERALYYGVEQRWRAFPFWQRRGAFFTGVAAA